MLLKHHSLGVNPEQISAIKFAQRILLHASSPQPRTAEILFSSTEKGSF